DGIRDFHVTGVQTCALPIFGLFNPAPSFMGIVGELVAAAFNPQLAAWSHAPAAVEIESWTLAYLARRCGLGEDAGGSFTSGGARSEERRVGQEGRTRGWVCR